jgi:SAM-dependent methyltransferase
MRVSSDEIRQALDEHLAWWGLQRFESDEAYFRWQRERLSSSEIDRLHRHVEQKRSGASADEVAFYDAAAQPAILPVLYSQRYHYYLAVGPRVAAWTSDTETVLDFGCGTGILTTFYAKRFPEKAFVGIDRSPASVDVAQQRATALGLTNVRFECVDVMREPIAGAYDLIVATHALVQAEQDPGLPSRDWTTFERAHDGAQQRLFEERTGVGSRLDRLCAALAPQGRMVVFEKTRQLARRVPFQRALAARGLVLVAEPEPVRYRLVEEVVDDGPFYVLQRRDVAPFGWDESPEPDEGPSFDAGARNPSVQESDAPLYENHRPSAQRVWEGLTHRRILREKTRGEADGRQWHVELGQSDEGLYLYCANTFDQRQIVLVEPGRSRLLSSYYDEIVGSRS